jgi:hypothetical protein
MPDELERSRQLCELRGRFAQLQGQDWNSAGQGGGFPLLNIYMAVCRNRQKHQPATLVS